MDSDEVVNYGDGKLPGDGEELMEDITGILSQVDNNPAISETDLVSVSPAEDQVLPG
ncbi:hypothetical protein FRC06_009407 [Ceratobasidium sp. 370]|nr:hypothetical protein FRC06_009407 [Ceratobasidium sp. 370]